MLLASLCFDPRSQGPCKKKTMLSTSNRGCRRGFIGSDLYPLEGPQYIYCQKLVMCITCIYERHFEVPFTPAHPAPEGDVSAQMKTTFVNLLRGCTHTSARRHVRAHGHTDITTQKADIETYIFYAFSFRREDGCMLAICHYSRLLCLHSSLSLPNETAANYQNC